MMNKEEDGNKSEEVQALQRQVAVLQDLHSLREESYYRQQKLFLMERMIASIDRAATALEKLGIEEEFTEDYTVKEDKKR